MPFLASTTEPAQKPYAIAQIHLPAAWEHCEETVGRIYSHNSKVAESYRAFASSVQQAYFDGSLSADDVSRIVRAIEFSADKHQFQTRKDRARTPYIIHPIGVANHMMMVGNVRDADIIIAGLLHDTVEDTNTSFGEIQREFGATVEGYVRELTDDKSLPKAERKRLQIENASHKSAGAAMVKLADKHYNLSDMTREIPQAEDGQPWPEARIHEYFAWAKQVVDALPPVNPALKTAVDQVIQNH